MSFEIGSSSTITKRIITQYGTHESEELPSFENESRGTKKVSTKVEVNVKKKKRTKEIIRNNKVLGSAPEPRSPTLEKRPEYMIGTINFMGFVFVCVS